MFSDTVITPLVSFTWSAETQFLSCPMPLCRDFAEAKKLLLIVGAGSQSRTLHFFLGSTVVSGWICSRWMTLSFFLPSAMKICGWYYFCWHCVELIIPCFFKRTEVCRSCSCIITEIFSEIQEKYVAVKQSVWAHAWLFVKAGWETINFVWRGLYMHDFWSLHAWFLVSPWAMHTW